MGGRPKKLAEPKQRELARSPYDGRQTGTATSCRTIGVSRTTLYRALKDSAIDRTGAQRSRAGSA